MCRRCLFLEHGPRGSIRSSRRMVVQSCLRPYQHRATESTEEDNQSVCTSFSFLILCHAIHMKALIRLPAPPVRRAIREAAGLTQAEIAESVGVTRAAVARWESGARKPQRANRIRYHSVLADLGREASL